MVTGRKGKAVDLRENAPHFVDSEPKVAAYARNLRKNDLGGVIFGCKHSTMAECLSKQLFGLPYQHFSYVKNISPGLPLFLFNYSDRRLHGIYEAASDGQLHIDAYAWTDAGADRTQFPAQVYVRIKAQCQPLSENLFQRIIQDNYFSPHLFYFELDHAQTRDLIASFKPRFPRALNPTMSRPSRKTVNTVYSSPSLVNGNKFEPLHESGNSKNATFVKVSSIEDENQSREPVKVRDDLAENDKQNVASGVLPQYDRVLSLLEKLSAGRKSSNSSSLSMVPSELGDTLETGHVGRPSVEIEADNGHMSSVPDVDSGMVNPSTHMVNGNKSAPLHYDSNMKNASSMKASSTGNGDGHSKEPNSVCEALTEYGEQSTVSGVLPQLDGMNEASNVEYGSEEETVLVVENEYGSTVSDVCDENVEDSKVPTTLDVADENAQIDPHDEIQQLKNLTSNAASEIQQLKTRIQLLESKVGGSSATNSVHWLDDIIYLIGGYKDHYPSSSLELFWPSLDILKPLESMRFARSNAASVASDGIIFVIGGSDDNQWSDTVEFYDKTNDKWVSCPSMLSEKGSLGGAALNGKIFSVGGRNEGGCLKDVEIFDTILGKWLDYKPMNRRRFAHTTAELNGVIYAVGGFDAIDYLRSAERIDPREGYWIEIPGMKTRRACHSMAVFHKKLYCMGGYDSKNMVSSVEIYEPRMNSWTTGEPMKCVRGYAAAASLGDSLFVIGGAMGTQELVDNVECYKEGVGWTTGNWKAIGRRSHLSALVL